MQHLQNWGWYSMGKRHEAALKVKPILQKGAQSLSDEEALEVKGIYDEWEVGIDVKVHEKHIYNDYLYRCKQAHTTQADWTPDLTPNMWDVIDESHAGTIDDPKIAARNMEYTYGLYYLDPEDGLTYLCQYGDMQGTVTLAYLPHEAPTYFKLIS